MASAASEIRELPAVNESTGSYPERIADNIPINMPRYSNGQVRRDFERSPPWFLVHSPLMQIEGGILEVHSQGSSPFNTHPVNMWTFLFAMFTHYGAALYCAKCWLTGSKCSKICDLVGSISGSLASATFLSILVPPSFELLVFVVWMFHLAIYIDSACEWILNVAKMLCCYLSNGAVYVRNIWNRIIRNN